MTFRKQELKKCMIWMRNGISIGITWALVLLIAAGHTLGATEISIGVLAKMMLLISGGVFVFCLCFTKLLFIRRSFLRRLCFFAAFISVYQIAGFYWIGFFTNAGSVLQWTVYAGILLLSFLCCVLIYRAYCRRKGEVYTQMLNEYRKQRSH